jgi:hypothetical protein
VSGYYHELLDLNVEVKYQMLDIAFSYQSIIHSVIL